MEKTKAAWADLKRAVRANLAQRFLGLALRLDGREVISTVMSGVATARQRHASPPHQRAE